MLYCRKIIAIFGASLCLFVGSPSFAEESIVDEIRLDLPTKSALYLLNYQDKLSQSDVGLEISLTPRIEFWGGNLRPVIGGDLTSAGEANRAYGEARWETAPTDKTFLSIGVGGEIYDRSHQNGTEGIRAGGTGTLFYVPVEIGYELNQQSHISIFFDHANQSLFADPFSGEERLGIQFKFGF